MRSAYEKHVYPEEFEKAVKSLAAHLLRNGIIKVHEQYLIKYDEYAFRADVKDTFDRRKIY